MHVQCNNVGCVSNILIPVRDTGLTRECRLLNPEALEGPFRSRRVAFPCAATVLAGSKLGQSARGWAVHWDAGQEVS